MKLVDFDYYLPKELIAQYPPKTRGASRMMVLDRNRKTIRHKRFGDLVSYLKRGDTVVFNDTRVIPARIICKKETGGKAEIFLLKKIKNNLYEALTRPARRLLPGRRLICEDGKTIAEIVENRDVGKLIRFANAINIERDLKWIGQTPLPPYIKRTPERIDEERYQTVYARRDGSTASPTAGLHFTEDIMQKIGQRDVSLCYVTLHVSYGTFAPVKADNIERHRMHKEFFLLPEETQEKVERAKRQGGRVMAVGTTTTRVLEWNANLLSKNPRQRRVRPRRKKSKINPSTALRIDDERHFDKLGVVPGEVEGRSRTIKNQKTRLKDRERTIKGWTGLFIYPPYQFKIVDMLLTNFHLPKSTLLMLVSAFAGREFILKAYKEAIKENYRFYSYGDCMLII